MCQVITTFKERKRQKQLHYEKTLLRELSMDELHTEVNIFIKNNNKPNEEPIGILLDYCYEVVIEAYLTGAKYSRFGYLGESLQDVQIRSMQEELQLINTLYQFLYFSGGLEDEEESLTIYRNCKTLIQFWWRYGFEKGKRRYLLRLS
ncbi:MAG: DUF2521 family protein [Bacillaceae bacterium]